MRSLACTDHARPRFEPRRPALHTSGLRKCVLPALSLASLLSPRGPKPQRFLDCVEPDPLGTYGAVIKGLNKYGLAYVHMVRARALHLGRLFASLAWPLWRPLR